MAMQAGKLFLIYKIRNWGTEDALNMGTWVKQGLEPSSVWLLAHWSSYLTASLPRDLMEGLTHRKFSINNQMEWKASLGFCRLSKYLRPSENCDSATGTKKVQRDFQENWELLKWSPHQHVGRLQAAMLPPSLTLTRILARSALPTV